MTVGPLTPTLSLGGRGGNKEILPLRGVYPEFANGEILHYVQNDCQECKQGGSGSGLWLNLIPFLNAGP